MSGIVDPRYTRLTWAAIDRETRKLLQRASLGSDSANQKVEGQVQGHGRTAGFSLWSCPSGETFFTDERQARRLPDLPLRDRYIDPSCYLPRTTKATSCMGMFSTAKNHARSVRCEIPATFHGHRRTCLTWGQLTQQFSPVSSSSAHAPSPTIIPLLNPMLRNRDRDLDLDRQTRSCPLEAARSRGSAIRSDSRPTSTRT